MDWIRNERKKIQNVFNQWKALTLTFPVIDTYLGWKGGDGSQVRIGVNVMMVCDKSVFLLEYTIQHFPFIGTVTLNTIENHIETSLWSQGWLKDEDLGLQGDLV